MAMIWTDWLFRDLEGGAVFLVMSPAHVTYFGAKYRRTSGKQQLPDSSFRFRYFHLLGPHVTKTRNEQSMFHEHIHTLSRTLTYSVATSSCCVYVAPAKSPW